MTILDMLADLLTPVNFALSSLIIVLTWQLFGREKKSHSDDSRSKTPQLTRMKRRDMTVEELRAYDGDPTHNVGGRVLIAVNGTIFDVTRGYYFYGPGGVYHALAGRDASRMLATFELQPADAGGSGDGQAVAYDDLSDLNSSEMNQVKEWCMQFSEKYDIVGKLLKPGEDPTDYSDSETAHDHTPPSPSREQSAH